jgi:hypothetical protein
MHVARTFIQGVLVICAATWPSAAQAPRPDAAVTTPSGFGEDVDRDIARSRKATEPFRTVEGAKAAGYEQMTDCVEHQPHGAMGYHFKNDALYDATLDPEKPEVLVYERMPDGSFALNGVEHLVPIAAWDKAEAPVVMGQTLKRAEKLGFWYLHVWTWKASPTGVFADWNPEVKCPR